MTLDQIKSQAELDTIIDTNHLEEEASKIPQTHNKYLCMLLDEKVILENLESKYKILKRDKWLYYSGKLSEEELKQLGWEPFELNILKQDIDRFLEADADIILLSNKIFIQKEKINYIEGVIKIISNKIWNIRSSIEWIKFTQGL
jgi:Recombination, repair and ssDNA binding protein UvsY